MGEIFKRKFYFSLQNLWLLLQVDPFPWADIKHLIPDLTQYSLNISPWLTHKSFPFYSMLVHDITVFNWFYLDSFWFYFVPFLIIPYHWNWTTVHTSTWGHSVAILVALMSPGEFWRAVHQWFYLAHLDLPQVEPVDSWWQMTDPSLPCVRPTIVLA